MARARLLVTDNVPPDEDVRAADYCRSITVTEVGATLRGFLVREPTGAADQIPVSPGGLYTFQRGDGGYTPSQLVGTVSGNGGSVTLAVVEA